MSETGITTYGTEDIDNLNLASWMVANGIPIVSRKSITVTNLDSTTHDKTRGTWAFAAVSIDGKLSAQDLITKFKLPNKETNDPTEIYYLACHNWLCLKTCIMQNTPLFYTKLGKNIRLSNKSGEPIKKSGMTFGTSSLALCAIAITLGVLPFSYSYSLSKFYVQFPADETVKTVHHMLTHIDDIREDDMSIIALLSTAFYNREEMKKDVYNPQEQLAIKFNGQTAFVPKNADNKMLERIAQQLNI